MKRKVEIKDYESTKSYLSKFIFNRIIHFISLLYNQEYSPVYSPSLPTVHCSSACSLQQAKVLPSYNESEAWAEIYDKRPR